MRILGRGVDAAGRHHQARPGLAEAAHHTAGALGVDAQRRIEIVARHDRGGEVQQVVEVVRQVAPVGLGQVDDARLDARLLDPFAPGRVADAYPHIGTAVPLWAMSVCSMGMIRGTFGDPDNKRMKEVYFSQFPGNYLSGDGARTDQDGDFWLMGRIDDVINISGHRLGTAEVESALVSHESVAEAAVVEHETSDILALAHEDRHG